MKWFKRSAPANEANGSDERASRAQWMDEQGFRLVTTGYGYEPGFDRNREYQFMRDEWSEPTVFRLCDCDPMMNVWGLRYRP